MATSGSYDWTSTRDFIITEAFKKIGRLGDFETLDSQRLTAGINALNPMIKAFQGLGMPVWAVTEQYLPFTHWATTPTVSIGPGATIAQAIKPLKIVQAIRRDNTNASFPVDVPLDIQPYENYELQSSKQSQGAPNTLFYQPLGYTGQISLWPLPDSTWQTNGQLYIRYQRPFQDFDASTDEPDFPVEWHEALIYNLAVRLAPNYGVPIQDRGVLKQEAKDALDLAKEFDTEEGSLYLQPAPRW